jgi:hypothetical protein
MLSATVLLDRRLKLERALVEMGDRPPLDFDEAAVGAFEAVQASDQGRLAGAAAPDQAENLSAPDGQRDAIERRRRSEALRHRVQANDRLVVCPERRCDRLRLLEM